MKSNKKLLAVLSVPAITSLLAVAIATPVKAADRDFHDNSVTPAITYANADYTSSDDSLNSLITALTNHPAKMVYEYAGKGYNYQDFLNNYKAAHQPGTKLSDAFKTALAETTPVSLVTVSSVDNVADMLVDNGTTADKLGLPTTVGVTLSDGTKDTANVAWNTSTYDGTKAGLQTITGTLSVPTGKTWTLTDAQKAVSVKVTVKALSLQVSSVSPVTSKTEVQVVLADGQDDIAAANKDNYVVKVGDTQVPVTSVAYVKDAKKATLTLDLTGQDGTITVNGVAAQAAIDFKAPQITNVTPVNLTTAYVDYSEKVSDTAINNNGVINYGVVVKGTATVGKVTNAERVSDTRVRLTFAALKAGTTYTLTTSNVADANGNVMATTSNDFTAVNDTTKPVVTGVTQVDGADGATLTVKFSEEVTGNKVFKLQKYDSNGNLTDANLLDSKASTNTTPGIADSVTISAPRLDDGAKYCLTIKGDANSSPLTDLAGNNLDEQKVDFTAVRDTVPPSIVSTTSQDGKLTIAFSEKVNKVDSIPVVDSITGIYTTVFADQTNTDATKLVFDLATGTDIKAGTNYITRLTNVTDLAGNAMDAQNVTFVGSQKPVKVGLYSVTNTPQTAITDENTGKALAALSANTVAVKFNTSVSKAEAENIANYKIYAGDKTKTLAVTNAVYDDSKQTVTLTTADQVQNTVYTVEVSGLTNLDTDATKTTATFKGVDYKAPVLKSVAQTGKQYLTATFDEAVSTAGVKATLISTDYSDSIGVSASSADANGNLVLKLTGEMTAGKTYVLRLEGVQDATDNHNYRVAGSTSAVVTSTQIQADKTAPKVTSAVAINSKDVEFTFDKVLDSDLNDISKPTVTIKDANGNVLTCPNDSITVSGNKVTVKLTTDASKLLTGQTYTAEIGTVSDLIGNKTASPITTTFVGNNDETSPKLVSAASTIVKGSDYKVGESTVSGVTNDQNYTEVTLTFDETVRLANPTAFVAKTVITTPNLNRLYPIAGSAKVGEDGKTIQFLVNGSTNAGDKYIVNVGAVDSVKDMANDDATLANSLDATANYASFTGVDTTAPTITGLTINDKDGKAVNAAATVSGNTITLTLGDTTEYTPGSLKLSEDVKASLDATNNNYDVSGISVSKDADSSALTNLALGLYGKNGATGSQIKAALNGATITLEDAVGNKTPYTIQFN